MIVPMTLSDCLTCYALIFLLGYLTGIFVWSGNDKSS